MRIFRQGAGVTGPENTGFGIERQIRAKKNPRPAFGYVLKKNRFGTVLDSCFTGVPLAAAHKLAISFALPAEDSRHNGERKCINWCVRQRGTM
jgi:hypothetical protein